MWGADADELERIATLLRRSSADLEHTGNSLGRQLFSSPWSGSAAEHFRRDWSARHGRMFSHSAAFLREAAEELAANARNQRAASSAAGGSVGSMPRIGGGPGRIISPERYWRQRALEVAGIDGAGWDPSKGFSANIDNIRKVYEYYANLYRGHPELAWAAMAALVGPAFIAGFADLAQFRALAADIDKALSKMKPMPPGAADIRDLMRLVADMSEDDLAFFETTFLKMQKQIFMDMAPMHTAYAEGGIEAVRALLTSGSVHDPDGKALRSWELINEGTLRGDASMIRDGTLGLVRREQNLIIAQSYDQMRHYKPPLGEALTYLMTVVGRPSIPGAHSFADVFPLTLEFDATTGISTPRSILGVEVPHVGTEVTGTVTVETPLPAGNVSNRIDRWDLIMQDTFPAFDDLYRNHPDQLQHLLDQPVLELSNDYRIGNRIPEILEDLVTDWNVEVSTSVSVDT